jgi:hypothetical protein
VAKRGTTLTGAFREARRPYRLFLLRALSALEEQSSAKFFPLSLVMTGEIHGSDIRNALRGLYRAGMIRTGPGGYALTELGRSALVNVWASSRRHPRATRENKPGHNPANHTPRTACESKRKRGPMMAPASFQRIHDSPRAARRDQPGGLECAVCQFSCTT